MSNIKSVHFKMYKPYGVLSQLSSNNDKETKSKHFLTALHNFPKGIMPIGRLDEKSEGLLLLTNDGKLSDTINRSGIEKEYYVQLDGEITDQAIQRLKNGVEIGFDGKKYITDVCVVKKLAFQPSFPNANKKIRIGRHRPNSWISLTLTEGKFRQVRKMTAAVGFPTLRLLRVRIGDITLDGLQPGMVQPMSELKVPHNLHF